MSPYSPLLASYGGGHAQIVSVVARALTDRGVEPTVIGFTTGYQAIKRAGLNCLSVETLLEPGEDDEFLEAVKPLLGSENHPDVTPRESQIYFALGLRDLVERCGWDAAWEKAKIQGRKAFEPVTVMRRYLKKHRPDAVVTTTSPRFELALLKAASALSIPSLAIGDLFLVKETEWITSPGYAKRLAVLNDEVANRISGAGYPRDQIVVTGNPAFDSLAPRADDDERRRRLRSKLGLSDRTVILWPAASSHVSMIGRSFLAPEEVVAGFEALCAKHKDFTYIFRVHPNARDLVPQGITLGQLDPGELSVDDAILVSDVVCVEASTVGLQAAIKGRPVICVGYADYVVYPQHGLAMPTSSLDEALHIIAQRAYQAPSPRHIPPVGNATARVLDCLDDLITIKP